MTTEVPAVFGVTVPTPWLMLTDVDCDELQLKVELAPLFTTAGDADRLTTGSRFTVTVAVRVTVSKELATVRV